MHVIGKCKAQFVKIGIARVFEGGKMLCVTNRGDVLVDGTVLRRIREERFLTQEDFAEHIGVKRNWLNATERAGRRLVLRSIVVEIAKRLGIPPGSLIAPSRALK